MVVGSFASTAHGEPRTTRDLDLDYLLEVGWTGIRCIEQGDEDPVQ